MKPLDTPREKTLHDLAAVVDKLPIRELELLAVLARVLAWCVRWLLAGVLIVSLAGPLPPLLPRRSGPASFAQYRARCAATISPAAWPSRCPAGWQIGGK
jgi:hypothetical protein